MIGTIIGILLAIQYGILAWNGMLEYRMLILVGAMFLIGIIFSFTAGTALTAIALSGVVIIPIALLTNGLSQALVALVISVCSAIAAMPLYALAQARR
jgi:hypothetical protein